MLYFSQAYLDSANPKTYYRQDDILRRREGLLLDC